MTRHLSGWATVPFALTLLLTSVTSDEAEAGLFDGWFTGRPYYAGYPSYTANYGMYTGYRSGAYRTSYTPYVTSVASYYPSYSPTTVMAFSPSVGMVSGCSTCGCSPCSCTACSPCATPCTSCMSGCPTGGCATGNCPGGNCQLNYTPASTPTSGSTTTGREPTPITPRRRTFDDGYDGGDSILPGTNPRDDRTDEFNPRERTPRTDETEDDTDGFREPRVPGVDDTEPLTGEFLYPRIAPVALRDDNREPTPLALDNQITHSDDVAHSRTTFRSGLGTIEVARRKISEPTTIPVTRLARK